MLIASASFVLLYIDLPPVDRLNTLVTA
jgi:hypothetical protein